MNNKTFNPLYLLLLIIPVAFGCYWLIKNQEKPIVTPVISTNTEYPIQEQKDYSETIKSFDLILTQSYNPIVNWPYRDRELIRQEILQVSKAVIDYDTSKISKTSERMEANYQYETLCKHFYALLIEMIRFEYIEGSLASYQVKNKSDYFTDVFFDSYGRIKTFTVYVLAKSVYREYLENR